MKKVRQINNIKIKYSNIYQYSCWNNGICYEDRLTLKQAEEWATNTKDFIKNKTKKEV